MKDNTAWIRTEHKDISFEHCGVPAYWEGDDVYCSKCQEKLDDLEEVNLVMECEHPDLKHTDSSAHLAFCPDCDLEFECECEEVN